MPGTKVVKLPVPTSQIERVVVTPVMAGELLEHNRLNRPIRDLHVQRIAAQIATGKWKFNGDTIKIADTGDVLDGQHRLWAIIEAKTPVETVIIRGIDREAFATIDTIRSVRSGADVLALSGVSRYRNIISSALQWLLRWQNGTITNFRAPENRIENSDIERAHAAHPAMVRAVEASTRLRGLANPSIMGFFYYVLSNRNQELADRMMATLIDPASVSVEDPFFRLREYFISEHHKFKDPVVTIALAIKAANAASQNREVKRLFWRNTIDPFPTLDV